jgi:hypothetical protein
MTAEKFYDCPSTAGLPVFFQEDSELSDPEGDLAKVDFDWDNHDVRIVIPNLQAATWIHSRWRPIRRKSLPTSNSGPRVTVHSEAIFSSPRPGAAGGVGTSGLAQG